MSDGKRVQRKEITAKTTVKAVITGYIAYGILFGFIVFMLGLFIVWISKQLPNNNYRTLSFLLPLLGIFILYFTLHFVCKLSIYDVFIKCKTDKDGLEKILTRLNLFLIICVAISVISVVLILTISFNNQKSSIIYASTQYSTIHSKEFTKILTNKMFQNYQEQKQNTIISTIILEMGLTISLFSLIPYQKKMIEKYN